MKSARAHIKLAMLIAFIAVVAACFSKREYGKNESVGETTNQAVNPLMDGDADREERPLALREEVTAERILEQIGEVTREKIALAQLAREKTNDRVLKNLASSIEAEASGNLNELKKLGEGVNYEIPETAEENTKNIVIELQHLEGDEFRREWLEEVIEVYKSDVDLFQAYGDKVENENIRSWMDSELSEMKAHLDDARALKEKVYEKN